MTANAAVIHSEADNMYIYRRNGSENDTWLHQTIAAGVVMKKIDA